jgi:hypothetical protein
MAIQRPKRWEARREASTTKLENPLRPDEVLEAVLTEVDPARPSFSHQLTNPGHGGQASGFPRFHGPKLLHHADLRFPRRKG